MRAGALRTNLIIHHRVADILDQTTKLVHILGGIQDPRNLSPPFQRAEVLENLVQFPGNPHPSDLFTISESVGVTL